MAEEILRDNETENQNEKVDTQTEKSVPVSELQRRLESQNQKHAEEIENLKQSQSDAIAQAIEKYRAENELSGKELEEYRKREAERKEQEYLDRIAELELANTRRELKDEAIKTLSDRNLPVNEHILKLVAKDSADEQLSAIDAIEKVVLEIRNQYSKSEPPMMSGGYSDGRNTFNDDVFKKAKITSF